MDPKGNKCAVAMLDVAPPLRTFALSILADVLLAQGRTAEASSCAEEAMAELEGEGRVEEGEAFLRLVHAEIRWALGDHEGARSRMGEAARYAQTMATRIDDPDLRASFLAMPEVARTFELARRWKGDGEEP